MLVPAETVSINFATYEVVILNADYSLRRHMKVSSATLWRLGVMWIQTPKIWRSLEKNRAKESIATFRHRREIIMKKKMSLKKYLHGESKGLDNE